MRHRYSFHLGRGPSLGLETNLELSRTLPLPRPGCEEDLCVKEALVKDDTQCLSLRVEATGRGIRVGPEAGGELDARGLVEALGALAQSYAEEALERGTDLPPRLHRMGWFEARVRVIPERLSVLASLYRRGGIPFPVAEMEVPLTYVEASLEGERWLPRILHVEIEGPEFLEDRVLIPYRLPPGVVRLNPGVLEADALRELESLEPPASLLEELESSEPVYAAEGGVTAMGSLSPSHLLVYGDYWGALGVRAYSRPPGRGTVFGPEYFYAAFSPVIEELKPIAFVAEPNMRGLLEGIEVGAVVPGSKRMELGPLILETRPYPRRPRGDAALIPLSLEAFVPSHLARWVVLRYRVVPERLPRKLKGELIPLLTDAALELLGQVDYEALL